MIKKLSQTRRGVATIIGSILSIVILLFFFSNVFLWYNGVSRQMSLVMADKLNSQIELTTTVLEGTPQNCTGDPVFSGYGGRPDAKYGSFSGSYMDTNEKNGSYQVLTESEDSSSDYIALNATYSFNVDLTEVKKSSAITFSFYGKYLDDPEENCKVYLWNDELKIPEDTGITITSIESWYNATISNPNRFVSSNGTVKVRYLSTLNSYNQSVSPESKGELWIDSQNIVLSPVGLKVQALGGRDVRLLRLWIINETINNHAFIDFEQEFGTEIWVTGGSSKTIKFVENKPSTSDGIIRLNLSNVIDYSIVLGGKISFRVLTDLGNTAMTTYEA